MCEKKFVLMFSCRQLGTIDQSAIACEDKFRRDDCIKVDPTTTVVVSAIISIAMIYREKKHQMTKRDREASRAREHGRTDTMAGASCRSTSSRRDEAGAESQKCTCLELFIYTHSCC